MKEDKILLANIEDKMNRCIRGNMPTYSTFLDMRQRTLVEALCNNKKGLQFQFIGGYAEAERTIAAFLPEYRVEESPISALRVTAGGGVQAKKLTHRDYLGSMMALGVKREMIGDILVTPHGCDIIVLREIVDFFLYHYGKVGRTSLTLEEIPLADIFIPEGNFQQRHDTISSLRLDNVVASAFSVSRSVAASAINQGQVYVNSKEIQKVDQLVEEGDRLVLRGKGKVILKEVGGTTRKNKISITLNRYL
ncbi:MAG: YlmH/Sll1252 family protein [Anaerovorax sp.]